MELIEYGFAMIIYGRKIRSSNLSKSSYGLLDKEKYKTGAVDAEILYNDLLACRIVDRSHDQCTLTFKASPSNSSDMVLRNVLLDSLPTYNAFLKYLNNHYVGVGSKYIYRMQ